VSSAVLVLQRQWWMMIQFVATAASFSMYECCKDRAFAGSGDKGRRLCEWADSLGRSRPLHHAACFSSLSRISDVSLPLGQGISTRGTYIWGAMADDLG
jgi:hypothetical protein